MRVVAGVMMTGHQKGQPRQPCASSPFWRIIIRTPEWSVHATARAITPLTLTGVRIIRERRRSNRSIQVSATANKEKHFATLCRVGAIFGQVLQDCFVFGGIPAVFIARGEIHQSWAQSFNQVKCNSEVMHLLKWRRQAPVCGKRPHTFQKLINALCNWKLASLEVGLESHWQDAPARTKRRNVGSKNFLIPAWDNLTI